MYFFSCSWLYQDLAYNAVFYQNGQQLMVAPMFAMYNGALGSGRLFSSGWLPLSCAVLRVLNKPSVFGHWNPPLGGSS